MKRIIFIIPLGLFLCSCTSMQFYVCGVEINRKDLNPYTVVGATASIGTHVLGHYVFAELNGVEIHQEETMEIVDYYETDSDFRKFARGGFILQHSVNILLTTFERTRNTSFTKGYTITTALETWFYPLRFRDPEDEGDFHSLDKHGGNGEAEHNSYSAIALYNILRIKNN